jgi:hypothetical protein
LSNGAALFSLTKHGENTMVASARIASYLSRLLGLPVVDDASIAGEAHSKIRTLVVVNGVYSFVKQSTLAALGEVVERVERIIWVQNDYTITPPTHDGTAETPFRRAFRTRHFAGLAPVDFWTTVEAMSSPERAVRKRRVAGPLSRLVNWNCLTLEPREPLPEPRLRDRAVYYGSYRLNRKHKFDAYFGDPRGGVRWEISSPSRRFSEEYLGVAHQPKFANVVSGVAEYGVGLCLQDAASDKEYHSPPNRFYEMLSAGVPIAVDSACEWVLERAGYECDEYLSRSSRDVADVIARRDEVVAEQRRAWMARAAEERESLDAQVRDLWREVTA